MHGLVSVRVGRSEVLAEAHSLHVGCRRGRWELEVGRRGSLIVDRSPRPGGRLAAGPAVCAVAAAGATAATSPASYWWLVSVAAVLGYAAATDWAERRVPRWSVRVGSVVAGLSIVVVSWRGSDWAPTARAGVASTVALVGLGWLWWKSPHTIGLGDVRVLALALGAAAAVSWRAVTNVLFATAVAGMAVAVWFATVRARSDRSSGLEIRRREMSVPLVPPLCVGFIVGVGAS